MHAIVLAAGAGSRLHPLTAHRPKPMVPVAGKPILQWCLEALRDAGVRDVTLVVGHRAQKVQSHVQNGRALGLTVDYVHQDSPIGTAHAVACALRERGVPDAAIVLGGDNVVDAKLVRELLEAGPDSVVVAASGNPRRYGVVTLEAGYVRAIHEKPSVEGDALVWTGAALLSRATLDRVGEAVAAGVTDLPGALHSLVADGARIRAVVSHGAWLDAVYPWDLVPLTDLLLHQSGGRLVSQYATVSGEAVLEGAVHVAEGATIGARAIVTGPSSIGANARVEPGAVVARSVLLPDAKVGPGAIVEGSVVAEGATIGAGAVLGVGPVEAPEGHGHTHVGAIVGEGSVVGPGAVLAPGTILGINSNVAAGAVARGRIPDHGWVF